MFTANRKEHTCATRPFSQGFVTVSNILSCEVVSINCFYVFECVISLLMDNKEFLSPEVIV